MNIGNQISAIRKEQQLTQEQFRSLFHVTRQTVSNWENEKTEPDIETLHKIAEVLEVSIEELIYGSKRETTIVHNLSLIHI